MLLMRIKIKGKYYCAKLGIKGDLTSDNNMV